MLLSHSKICINPPIGVELSGYGYFLNRRNIGIRDDIMARALFLQQEEVSYLLICCDLLGFHPMVVERVKEELSKILNIPQQAILLLCTHTHTAPASMWTLGCGEIDNDYLNNLIDQLIKVGVKAAIEALDREVTGVKWIEQPVEPIGYNRAIPGGPVDNNLYALVFELKGAKPYVIACYSCHPVMWGPSKLVSADFPGVFTSLLDGRGYDGMFVNGFLGDIDPISNSISWGSATQEIVDNYGKILADGLDKGLENAKRIQPSISYTDFTFNLELAHYSIEELDAHEKQSYSVYPENPVMHKVVNEWVKIVKQELTTKSDPYTEPLYVQIVKIGSVIIAALQGEIYTQIGFDIRSSVGNVPLMLISNANAATRYIATDDEIEKGTYGGFEYCYSCGRLPLKKGNANNIARIVAKHVAALQ
ncbi:MAG: hypothetical protein HPY74_13350 [Firmicutes bacterium]|nr:hypothetical protein [Bacillota bacterium]